MPSDVRYAPYVSMAAPHDPAVRPIGFRPHRPVGTAFHPQQVQQHIQQQQKQRITSPTFYQDISRIQPGAPQMIPPPVAYPLDARSLSSRGWEYSSPGYSYYTSPPSNGGAAHPTANSMMAGPPPVLVAQSRYLPPPPQPTVSLPVAPPRLPDRRIMPYNQPSRGFWVDQFASVDVSRQEPLPQDWHPFVDAMSDPVPAQPPATGGVMAVLDYDPNIMAAFVANVSCNFINLHKPWTSLCLFVEKVLNQTRLPSSTVILGITYLSKRLSFERPHYDQDPDAPLIPKTQLYEYLTISLVLANKFLDDNTFTNTSWSDISGIPRQEINVSERDWLKKLGYDLHLNPTEQKGWSTWRKAWETWEFDATGKRNAASLLTPVLSRSNSSMSSPRSEKMASPQVPTSFPSANVGWTTTTKPCTSTRPLAAPYLTPPISPTFDSSIDMEFLSPITPPSNGPWALPLVNSGYPQPQQQVSWQPLPNTRNIPMSMYLPVFQKPMYPPHTSWDLEKGTKAWCECNVCLGRDHTMPRPKWLGLVN